MKALAPIRLKSGIDIGPGRPAFIVAEIGNNHQGELKIAKKMIDQAAQAGVQAVKFQKRDVDSLFTRAGKEAPYGGDNSFGPTYGEHRAALELSLDEMAELKRHSESQGLVFFASAWDGVSNKQMLDLGVELIKICSADLVNLPMLRQCGRTGLPLILSTGMSPLPEIDAAVAELRRFHDKIVLLSCNSSYPCPEEEIGLPVISLLRRRYGLPTGYSGHERGIGPSVASAALGACVIERHFTLDKNMRGTDHQASLEPAEMKLMIQMVREVEKAMLIKDKKVFPKESASAAKLRKSIVFARDLPSGHVLCEADLCVKCPGTGVSPMEWDRAVGARLNKRVACDEQLDWNTISLPTPALARKVIS